MDVNARMESQILGIEPFLRHFRSMKRASGKGRSVESGKELPRIGI